MERAAEGRITRSAAMTVMPGAGCLRAGEDKGGNVETVKELAQNIQIRNTVLGAGERDPEGKSIDCSSRRSGFNF